MPHSRSQDPLFSFLAGGLDPPIGRCLDAGTGELPRRSPTRVGTGLDWHLGNLRAAVDYEHVFEVTDTAAFETPTDGYNNLRLNITYHAFINGARFELFLKGDNLSDETQRVNTSFLKDFVPRPGISIAGGVRVHL